MSLRRASSVGTSPLAPLRDGGGDAQTLILAPPPPWRGIEGERSAPRHGEGRAPC